ncbi:MAG: hypothetical protein H7308_01170 [Chthonomonadaceae bacterium]|nr:hypothetical protein [Chthonomonadaceae bacterium]
MITLKSVLDYLTKMAPPEDPDKSAALLLQRLRSENDQTRINAEMVISRIGYEWESFYEEEFVVAVLHRLSEEELPAALIERALMETERIVLRGGRTEPKRRVVDTAKECLQSLTQKHTEQLARQQLLRPSERETETLLRSLSYASDRSPQELLRPKD